MSIRIGGMIGKTILAAVMFIGLLIALNLLVQNFCETTGWNCSRHRLHWD